VKGGKPDTRKTSPGPNPVPVRGQTPIQPAPIPAAKPNGTNGTHAPAAASAPPPSGGAKTEPPKDERVAAIPVKPLAYVSVPAVLLRAAALCVGKEATRYYLAGVYLHRHGPCLRCVGTDGKRMLVLSVEAEEAKLPAWLDKGIIIPAEGLKARLALIEDDEVRIGYAEGAPRLELADKGGGAVFRLSPIDGTYPDYRAVMAGGGDAFLSGNTGDFASVALESQHMKGVADIAKALDCESVRAFAGGDEPGTPRVLTFPSFPGAVLYLMPAKADGRPVLQADTRALLAPALKATVAALKAHATRWHNALKDAKTETARGIARERIAAYGTRIADAIRAEAKGLPAPESPKKDLPPSPTGAAIKAEAGKGNGVAPGNAPAQASAVKALPAPAPKAPAPPISRGVIAKGKRTERTPVAKRGKAA
jgi:hypothetical protein